MKNRQLGYIERLRSPYTLHTSKFYFFIKFIVIYQNSFLVCSVKLVFSKDKKVTTARWVSHLNSQRESQLRLEKIPIKFHYLLAYWRTYAMAVKNITIVIDDKRVICVTFGLWLLTHFTPSSFTHLVSVIFLRPGRKLRFSIEFCYFCLVLSQYEIH